MENLVFRYGITLFLSLAHTTVFAETHATHGEQHDNYTMRGQSLLKNIFRDNLAFTKEHRESCFAPYLKSQTPRATMVMCSDSRVQTYSFDSTPDNDLFVVRNIGNQLASNEGSVEYGVHHLSTPILFFLGHTGCGAVKAALSDYSKLSPTIRREIGSIRLKKRNLKSVSDADWLEGVTQNVSYQVAQAVKKFAKEVADEKLVVVGGVFDLHNAYEHSNGKILIVNVNGKTDDVSIHKLPMLTDLEFDMLPKQ